MARKKNILVVTGTRAEYGLLRPVMEAIKAHPKLSLSVLATGMHTLKTFGSTVSDVKRRYKTHVVPIREKSTMLEALAEEIQGVEAYCVHHRPDCIVVLGDRDEPLAAAIVAAHLNIPLAHIHGGDVTGPGIDEGNRTLITKLANLHFPATKMSAERIKGLGEESWRITIAGTPGLDGLRNTKYTRAEIAQKLGLDVVRPWLLFIQHPAVFEKIKLPQQIASSRSLAYFPSHEKIIIYPNSDTGSTVFISHIRKLKGRDNHIFVSLSREEYLAILKSSDAIVGNSSSGVIEANFLGTPAVDIGNRQQGRERGTGVLHAPYDTGTIVSAIKKAIVLKKRYAGHPIPSPYGRGAAGKVTAHKIATLLNHPKIMRKTNRVDRTSASR